MMNKTFIISGEVHGGKTIFANNLASLMAEKGFIIDGFVCPGIFENAERSAFYIRFLATGDKIPYAKKEQVPKWISFKRFYFNPAALEKGNGLLKTLTGEARKVVFVDELGRWELEGGGWSEGVRLLVQKPDLIKILVVRTAFVNEIITKFNLQNTVVLNIQNESVQKAYDVITDNKI